MSRAKIDYKDLVSSIAYEELFMNDQERADARKPKVDDIDLTEIVPFREHPFQVREDEEMERLKESIKEYGVLVPALARPTEDGKYELVSGHRRMAACKALGMKTMPVIIRNLTDEEAVITMVDANLQREHILPSEKAFAYKMKYDAIKRAPGRKENGDQLGHESRSIDELADSSPDSRNQIQRYIRLTNLTPKLLDQVDRGSIALTTAVELSYLKPFEQEWVQEAIDYEKCTPSLSQACRLKKASQSRTLVREGVLLMMQEEKPNQRGNIKLSREELNKFFPSHYTDEQIKQTILRTLEHIRQQRSRKAREER